MNYFFDFLSHLPQGYGVSTIIFLILSLFSKRFEHRRKYYLSTANTIAAVTGMLMACSMGVAFFRYQAFPFLISVILLCGISLLTLLSPKLRQHILFTLLLILLLNIAYLVEPIYVLITTFASSDYLPSSWSYYYDYRNLFIYQLPISILFFTLVFIIAGKKQSRETII
jgi:hypothetical protein